MIKVTSSEKEEKKVEKSEEKEKNNLIKNILIVIFFPVTVPYLVWTKTSWNKWVKIGITVICFFIIISPIIDSNKSREEASVLVDKAEILITENRIEDALSVLSESQKIDRSSSNRAFLLEDKVAKLNSFQFLKETIANMTEEEVSLLNSGELNKRFINHEHINKLFIDKLHENIESRDDFIAEIEEEKRIEKERIEAEKREEKISNQFSAWDGSHRELTKIVKKSMHNPNSYEHVETVYWDMGDHLVVNKTFRGTNALGGVVANTVKAKISIDGESIEIIEQY